MNELYLDIKSRVMRLGKRLLDLEEELKKRGCRIPSTPTLTMALQGRNSSDNAQLIRRLAPIVVGEWEAEVQK